ncbi:MAG: hypothetical protein E7665_01635 [Ruminococcaceae bacterium]|nr:hypothetical protein [Oscillospiraceae bacterium]
MAAKEKEIKITEKDLADFSVLYPEMTNEQLTELALGDKAGINFSSYASSSLSPEEMKNAREALIDSKKRNTALFECRYFTPAAHVLASLFNPCEKLADALINESIKGLSYKDIGRFSSSNGVLQGKSDRVYASYLAGREIISGMNKEENVLPEKYADMAKKITVKENLLNTEIFFNMCGECNIYKTFGKNGQDIMKGITLSEKSSFIVRDKMVGYNESYFSIALEFEGLTVSLAVVPNTSAVKGNAAVSLIFADEIAVYVDSATKYFDTSLLTAGLKS